MKQLLHWIVFLEHKIIQTLEQEYRHLTKVMIAHRLSTVQDATQIYFLEDGKITGVGTHSELLESHPHYQEFVKKTNDSSITSKI